MSSPLGPILWQSEDHSIFLVDIPGSIEAAQGHGFNRKLLSCKPLDTPFPNTEPKSEKARKALQERARGKQPHSEIASGALEAIQMLKRNLEGKPVCLPRTLISSAREFHRKRSYDESSVAEALSTQDSEHTADDLVTLLSAIASRCDRDQSASSGIGNAFIAASRVHNHGCLVQGLGSKNSKGYFVCNPLLQPIDVVTSLHKISPYTFHLPGRSAFLLSQCEEISLFHRFIRESAAANHDDSDRFSVVLMDPPWPNSSARRKAAYDLSDGLWAIRDLLLDIPLSRYLAADGIVAVWVTNNHACRDLVLGSGGLFETWNVALHEEWVWVKITLGGEAIIPVDGLWRKPYELLLIGKNKAFQDQAQAAVRRRYIFGVPDLHSRKPCVKSIIEQVLLKSTREYRGLEIFARYLTQGWCSWGNEVMKYNWSGFWHTEG